MSRNLLKTLTRALYAGGTITLLVGMLLSSFSMPVAAASSAPADTVAKADGLNLNDLMRFPGPSMDIRLNQGNPTGASLRFEGGCNGNCQVIKAKVCNYTDKPMVQSPAYALYYSPSGNPKNGTIVQSGTFGPLAAHSCQTFTYSPTATGNYMWKANQESTHPGNGTLWSDQCSVTTLCTPVTETPVTKTPVTPTPVTETPTPVTETPVTETPVTETPVTETPVTETPVTETPVTKTPVTPTPVTETPVKDTPVTKTPVTPETPTPVTETPATETPVTETPVTETPTPVTETPTPVTETPVKDVSETPTTVSTDENKETTPPAEENKETPVPTFAPPSDNSTSQVLIPVTGLDLSNPTGNVLGSLFTNLGLIVLGLALLLTGITNRMR
jgi:hypothetical protein